VRAVRSFDRSLYCLLTLSSREADDSWRHSLTGAMFGLILAIGAIAASVAVFVQGHADGAAVPAALAGELGDAAGESQGGGQQDDQERRQEELQLHQPLQRR